MRKKGKITSWDDEKGFGFIAPHSGGKEVFVHIKSFTNRHRRPLENEIVSYKLEVDGTGRPRAERVRFRWERLRSAVARARRNISLLFTGACFIFLGGAAYAGELPYPILWFYAGASLVTFIAYALDKSAAQKARQRTRESTLHLFALVGGWPGALAAQRLVHHKSGKRSFQIVFWITVILNCVALGALLTAPPGSEVLRSVSGLL